MSCSDGFAIVEVRSRRDDDPDQTAFCINCLLYGDGTKLPRGSFVPAEYVYTRRAFADEAPGRGLCPSCARRACEEMEYERSMHLTDGVANQ